MAKRLPVVLSQTVNKLGEKGEVVEVAPGYARNYLIPQGIGVYATPGLLRQVEQRKEKERQRLLAEKQEAESRKTALTTINNFVIRKQVGEGDAIFGTVTTQDVAEIVKQSTGLEIDRRVITIPDISKTGRYHAQIKLHPEVTASIEVQVAPL